MKKILFIIFLFCCLKSLAQGGFGTQGDLEPTGQYGIVKAKNLRGGYYGSVHDTVARNLIPANFRDSNMLVYTRYDTTMWMLKGGLTNANWSVFSTGGNAGAYDSLLKLNNTWLGVNKFNRQIEVDSLKGAGTLYITGNLENSSDIKAGRRLQAGKSLVGNGIFRFYNYNHNYRTDLQGDSMLTSNVDLLLPSSSGKLALTTDIAPVDTTVVKTVVSARNDSLVLTAAINSKPNFGDVRDIVRDSLLIPKDTLLAHNTRILANTNAANTNAANINLKVNIADTASMLAGYRVASILTSGTLADARLSSNVPLKNTANTFTENQTISKSNPQVELVSATTAKATLLRGETTNTFSLTNDVLEIGGASSNCVVANSITQSVSSSPTSITGLTQWSVSFWFFANSGTNSSLIYFGDGTNAYRIRHAANTYIQLWYNGVPVSAAAVGSHFGVWNNVTITKDAGNTLRYYFNGNLISTTTTSNISTINIFRINNSADLPFGESGMDWTRYDQVLFYNTALTLANVQTIYAGGTGTTSLPSTGNLLLRYELNEGTGTTTVNQGSASDGNGTLVNSMNWGIANGRIPTEAAIQLGTAIQIRDGVLSGERGQYRFGDPFGGTILRGRSIKFQSPLETNFSLIHNGTSTLIDPTNTNTSATGASTVSVVGNATIGENVAAPTNGLRVVGNALFRANTFFGGTTTPTARVHVLASSTSASGGQIKLIGGGSRQSTPENGTINNVSGNLEFVDGGVVYILAKTLQKTSTLDFPSITSLTTSTLTVTLTGAADGDLVYIGVPSAAYTAGLIFTARVSATDTVSIDCYNSTGSNIDPASASFKISIVK